MSTKPAKSPCVTDAVGGAARALPRTKANRRIVYPSENRNAMIGEISHGSCKREPTTQQIAWVGTNADVLKEIALKKPPTKSME
jgi:hypothetical protein